MALADQVYGFFIPTVTLMGIGAHKELGAQAKALGMTKPLIVTDKGITAIGLTEKLAAMLREVGINPVILRRSSSQSDRRKCR